MPRRMRSATPYGIGLNNPQTPPSPQPVNTGWVNTLNTFGQQYGQHLVPGLQSLAQGALGAYNVQKQFPQMPIQPMQQLQPGQPVNNQQQQPTISPEEEEQEYSPQLQLSDLLSHLISQRIDTMGGMGQTYPSQLYSNAFNAANSQQSQQGPPQYRPNGPQFAFDQTLGGGAQYSPTAALGDYTQSQAPREWWRTSANQLGGLLGNLAPIAGTYGGLPGILGGAGLGALGYGLQQF